MTTVRQILWKKGEDIWYVAPESTVFEALETLAEKDIGAVLVVNEKEKLIGIFSERDYARKLVLKGKISKDTYVQDLMSQEIVFVGPRTTVQECMALMATKHVRHLPVVDEGKVVGVVTIGDVIHQVITDQKFKIEQLENYIKGDYAK